MMFALTIKPSTFTFKGRHIIHQPTDSIVPPTCSTLINLLVEVYSFPLSITGTPTDEFLLLPKRIYGIMSQVLTYLVCVYQKNPKWTFHPILNLSVFCLLELSHTFLISVIQLVLWLLKIFSKLNILTNI